MGAGAKTSKFQAPAPKLKEMNEGMQLSDISGITFTVGGMGKDSECTKLLEQAMTGPGRRRLSSDDGNGEGEDGMEKALNEKCKPELSKVEKVFLQVDFADGGLIKSERG